MTVLVVGASGYLGGELCRRAVAAGERVVGTYHTTRPTPAGASLAGVGPAGVVAGVQWRRLDARDRAAVRSLLTEVRPDTVLSMAYRIDDWEITADGAAHVAAAAVEVGARLVHMSSDALHAGRAEPYADDEPPSPVYSYGAAKAAAETAVRVVDPTAVIVRTSLIVGDERSKQVRLCLTALDGDASLFSDEIRCPVAVDDLAAAVRELARLDYAGIINVAGPEAVSRAELGRLVARRYGRDVARMRTTTIAEAGLVRPGEVRLDSGHAEGLLTTRLRGVTELFGS